MNKKTFVQKPADVERKWYLFDAKDATVGRLATEIATRLSGRNKVTFTPHVDGGDYVIVINAKEAIVTGDKDMAKRYFHHTGFPGGIRHITLGKARENKPELIIENAVKGMLPKNKLQAQMMKRLKVYAGAEHNHTAQQPQKVEVK